MFRTKSRSDLLRRKRKRSSLIPILFTLGAVATASYGYATLKTEAGPALSAARLVEPMPAVAEEPVQADPLAVETVVEEEVVEPSIPNTWNEGNLASLKGELAPNESVFLALQNKSVPQASIHAVVTAVGEHFDFRKARPGDQWSATVDPAGSVLEFRYEAGPEDVYVATRSNDGTYTSKKAIVAVETKRETLNGSIQSSLWGAFDSAGASPNLAQTFIDTFVYTIDFNEDTHENDKFSAVYEAVYLDGEKIRDGKLLAAKYQGETGTFYAFADEKTGSFYDADGDSLKRQFLKSPLPVTRVTSKYGRRFHPVLGKMKMHAGIDYGAPVGTTVFAAADGVVIYAGAKGANGNLVSIRHSGGYVTHYAHLSKIQPGIRSGKRVNQRDVIAKSGNTGRSTGPHLHYGMTLNGAHINPLKVDFTRGEPLSGRARDNFKVRVAELKKMLN